MIPALAAEMFADADRAFAEGQRAYIAFGQALSVLNEKGVTQQEIGKRYQLSQGAIAAAIAVGTDKRIIANSNNLPRSSKSLYLLTTLSDEDFEKLAKPETTQADIVKVKSPEKAQRGPSEAMQNRLHMQSLYRENDKLKAENAALKAEIVALKAALKAADDVIKAADAVMAFDAVKPADAAQETVKTPDKPKATPKPKAAPAKPTVKTKPVPPKAVDNPDRQTALLELYALYRAMLAAEGRDAELKPFDVWVKTSFLEFLKLSVTSRPGFEFLSDAKKLEVLTDAEFAENVADVRGVYES